MAFPRTFCRYRPASQPCWPHGSPTRSNRTSIWDTHTPEFSDGFLADFLSQPTRKSAMLAAWLAHALKSFRRKVLRDAITASSGVSAAPFYAETAIIWDTHTPEFSDGFLADFLSQPTRKSAMLAAWLAHALKSFRRKVLRDAITASSGVSAALFYAETTS